jgi:hypothetical protein
MAVPAPLFISESDLGRALDDLYRSSDASSFKRDRAALLSAPCRARPSLVPLYAAVGALLDARSLARPGALSLLWAHMLPVLCEGAGASGYWEPRPQHVERQRRQFAAACALWRDGFAALSNEQAKDLFLPPFDLQSFRDVATAEGAKYYCSETNRDIEYFGVQRPLDAARGREALLALVKDEIDAEFAAEDKEAAMIIASM